LLRKRRGQEVALETQLDNDWKAYRRLRNVANNFISKSIKRYFLSKFKEKVCYQSLWDIVNELTGFCKKIPVSITVLDHNNTTIGDKNRINDLLAKEFVVIPDILPDYSSLRLTHTLRTLFMMKIMLTQKLCLCLLMK
jgi:hypothetical protein